MTASYVRRDYALRLCPDVHAAPSEAQPSARHVPVRASHSRASRIGCIIQASDLPPASPAQSEAQAHREHVGTTRLAARTIVAPNARWDGSTTSDRTPPELTHSRTTLYGWYAAFAFAVAKILDCRCADPALRCSLSHAGCREALLQTSLSPSGAMVEVR